MADSILEHLAARGFFVGRQELMLTTGLAYCLEQDPHLAEAPRPDPYARWFRREPLGLLLCPGASPGLVEFQTGCVTANIQHIRRRLALVRQP